MFVKQQLQLSVSKTSRWLPCFHVGACFKQLAQLHFRAPASTSASGHDQTNRAFCLVNKNNNQVQIITDIFNHCSRIFSGALTLTIRCHLGGVQIQQSCRITQMWLAYLQISAYRMMTLHDPCHGWK